MNKKQRTMLARILAAAALLAALHFVPATGALRFLLYLVPYLVIGYDILIKAAKGIGDFNFIEGMACEGGCVQGPAQLIRSPKNQGDVDRHAKQAEGRTIEEAVAAAEQQDPSQEE